MIEDLEPIELEEIELEEIPESLKNIRIQIPDAGVFICES